ncbi:putative integral membrane protein [Frankia alni ACN14a]|uniref:Integral membrane protein n=1 Tax=Frankia alni (strain DSM 45986 / CECT 9034 / ACN14a) TaxID=326424 RepID=Q0RPD6_FRAAA|nr:putative integral membrane protein [Frankia alni ACN14a]
MWRPLGDTRSDSLPAVLIGPMLPGRAAARLAGFTAVATALVGWVGAGSVDVGSAGEDGWWRCGQPMMLAMVSAGAAAVRGWAARRHAAR